MAITPYNGVAKSGLKDIKMQPAYTLQQLLTHRAISNLNILWHIGWFLQSQNSPRPNWSGFMQRCCHGDHSAVASLQLLPMIDLKPSDESCVYNTLLYVHSCCFLQIALLLLCIYCIYVLFACSFPAFIDVNCKQCTFSSKTATCRKIPKGNFMSKFCIELRFQRAHIMLHAANVRVLYFIYRTIT